MSIPKIAIIIPCYLQAEYLDKCLESIYKQDYINWECIIVNDGSPDNTAEVAKKWVSKDKRFNYFEKKNGGLSSTRNFGLQQTKAEYIQFLDCDDFIHSSKFESFTKELSTNSHDILLSNFQMHHAEQNFPPYCDLKESDFDYTSVLLRWDIDFSIPIHCAIFKRSIIPPTGFCTELKAKEDWLFWIKIFEKKPTTLWKNKTLNYYRFHEKSMTKDRFFMMDNMKKANVFLVKHIKGKHIENFMAATHDRYMLILKSMDDEILNLKKSFENPNFSQLKKTFTKYSKRFWRKITNSS